MVEGVPINEETLEKVREKINEIINDKLPITKKIMSKKEAEEFYKTADNMRGKLQLEVQTRDIVTLYYCKDYYNYLYGVMPLTTGDISAYELVKYDNGILIRYPSRTTPNKIPKLKNNE